MAKVIQKISKLALSDTIGDVSFEDIPHYNTKIKKISMHCGSDLYNSRGLV